MLALARRARREVDARRCYDTHTSSSPVTLSFSCPVFEQSDPLVKGVRCALVAEAEPIQLKSWALNWNSPPGS